MQIKQGSDNIYFWCNFPCLFHIFHIVLWTTPQCTIFEKKMEGKRECFNGCLCLSLVCLLRLKSWLLSLLIKLSAHRQKKGTQVYWQYRALSFNWIIQIVMYMHVYGEVCWTFILRRGSCLSLLKLKTFCKDRWVHPFLVSYKSS